MMLREYLFQKRMTRKEFSKLIGYSTARLSQLMTGHVKPTIPMIRAIEKNTEGMVTFNDLAKEINTNCGINIISKALVMDINLQTRGWKDFVEKEKKKLEDKKTKTEENELEAKEEQQEILS